MSYSHSRKPDLHVTLSSPLSTWLNVLYFFSLPAKKQIVKLWVLLVVAVTLPSLLPYPDIRLFIVL